MLVEIKKIKLDDLSVPMENVRAANAGTAIDDLKTSIRSIGLIEPITAYLDESGQYVALVGQRRLLAYMQLNEEFPGQGFDEIECVVRDPPKGESMKKAVSLAENITHLPISRQDLQSAVTDLYMESGGDYNKVKERFGLTRYMVDTYVGLARLPDRLKQAILDGELHHKQRSAERIALAAASALMYVKGGDVSEDRVMELAQAMSKRGEIKKEIVKEVKKNPRRKISDIVERVENRPLVDLRLRISKELDSRLGIYSDDEDFDNKEEAAIDIIAEKLRPSGEM